MVCQVVVVRPPSEISLAVACHPQGCLDVAEPDLRSDLEKASDELAAAGRELWTALRATPPIRFIYWILDRLAEAIESKDG